MSSSRVDLSWSAASDNVGVTGYEVKKVSGCGVFELCGGDDGVDMSWSDTGRSPGDVVQLSGACAGRGGEHGGVSSVATAVTPVAVDIPPSAPTGLAAAAAGSGGVNLSWTAATDDLGVATYEVERCQGAGCSGFVQVATTVSTSLADTGLVASTSYSYRVRARNRAARWARIRVLRRQRRGPVASAAGGPRRRVLVRRRVRLHGHRRSGNGNGVERCRGPRGRPREVGSCVTFNGTNARVRVEDWGRGPDVGSASGGVGVSHGVAVRPAGGSAEGGRLEPVACE